MSTIFTYNRLSYLLLFCVIPRCIVYNTHTHINNNNKYSLLPLFPEMLILYYSNGVKSDWPFLFLPILFFTQVKGLGFRCHILPALRKVVSTILSDWVTRGSLAQMSMQKVWASTGIAHLPTAITDFFFQEHLQKNQGNIIIYNTKATNW